MFDTLRRSVLAGAKSRSRAVLHGLRLGLVPRLLVSFVGVAALIIAANVVVQQGILVDRTVQVAAPAPPPAPPPVVVTPPIVHVDPAPAASAIAPALLEDTLRALARFEHASQLRTADGTTPAEALYKQSLGRLDNAVTQIVNAPALGVTGNNTNTVRSALHTYTTSAANLAKAADSRRATEAIRAQVLERLNSRVKEPLASAWTIFGRVVARQSLVRLSDDIDSLRQHSEVLQASSPLTTSEIDALDAAEQRVQGTLTTNEASFRRGQGDAWFQTMATDLTQLMALRKSSIQLATDISAGLRSLSDQADALRQDLFLVATAAAPAVALKSESIAPAALPAPSIASAPAQPAVTQEARQIGTHTITHTQADSSSRRLVAWTSGAAALLMLLMCVSIVVSVVAPIRRLLRATSQIAKGDYSVRVASGGVREFDTLAAAFNGMADKLNSAEATNRQYQQGLEHKIQERTRSLQDLSERDPLTGLPNRRHLFALLDATLERAVSCGDCVGVLFLDIDNFKNINDGLGHAFGDNLLIEMGKRLAELTRPYGFAARLGGDEFTVVLDRAGSVEEIGRIGEAIVSAFHAPLVVDGRDLAVSVSVGACAYPIHAGEAAALLKAADMALFHAKSLGRSQLSMFTFDLLDAAAAKFSTEQGLRRAIERGEFELFFQPEINVETLDVGLVEALIRWRAPTGELLLPGAFLSVAEESGLAIEIGDWVLRSAIRAASTWHHGQWPDARVAINISPRQLVDVNFVDRVAALLKEYKLPARCIEIELTESILQTGPTTVESLRRLRELGTAVALDDFGTGFSSLASLEVLPLTRVKLDRSLISGIDTSHRSAAIAEAIIAMCQRLGLEITAEGVERPEQFAFLARQRTMCIQGFLLTQAISRDELLPSFEAIRQRARELVFTARETAITSALVPANRGGLRSSASTVQPGGPLEHRRLAGAE